MKRNIVILLVSMICSFSSSASHQKLLEPGQNLSTKPDIPLNIIIIKSDQHRWDLLGCMGHPVIKTPNIDKLASGSFILENEFTVSTLCVPSRTSFFTGKYVHRTANTSNAPDEHIKPGEWCFIEPLEQMGYVIGLAGKNHTFHDEYFDRYFDYREETSHFGKKAGTLTESDKKMVEYLGKDPRPGFEESDRILEGLVPGPVPFPEEQCPTYRIAEDGIRFLEENRDKPFLLYYSFGDPHWPTVVPEPYYSMYDPAEVMMEAGDFDWEGHPFKHYVQSQACGYDSYTEAQKRRIIATYYGQISFVDKAVGMLLDKLTELGLKNNTIVLFTSDHGDWGGNYGLIAKTGGFQESLVRIPGILWIPGLEGNGIRIKAQISNIDVMPTIYSYMDMPYPGDVQGLPFLDVLNGKKEVHRDVIYSEVGQPNLPPPPVSRDEYDAYRKKREKEHGMFWFIEYTVRGRMAMIRKDNWKFCYYTGDMNELYDY